MLYSYKIDANNGINIQTISSNNEEMFYNQLFLNKILSTKKKQRINVIHVRLDNCLWLCDSAGDNCNTFMGAFSNYKTLLLACHTTVLQETLLLACHTTVLQKTLLLACHTTVLQETVISMSHNCIAGNC